MFRSQADATAKVNAYVHRTYRGRWISRHVKEPTMRDLSRQRPGRPRYNTLLYVECRERRARGDAARETAANSVDPVATSPVHRCRAYACKRAVSSRPCNINIEDSSSRINEGLISEEFGIDGANLGSFLIRVGGARVYPWLINMDLPATWELVFSTAPRDQMSTFGSRYAQHRAKVW